MSSEENFETKQPVGGGDDSSSSQHSTTSSQTQSDSASTASASTAQDRQDGSPVDTLTLDLTNNPTLETLDLTQGRGASAILSDPERRRDWVRFIVTVGLLIILATIVVWSCIEAASWPDHWTQTKEMLQIILPAITGLIGSVIGFYFGTGSKSGGPGNS